MYFSAALAVFLTGVTEPLEFMFMFVAMPLYGVYAVIQGLAFAMADIINLRVHSFGNIELLTRLPISIKAGLGMDVVNFVICTIVFGVGTYFLANFLIKKFNFGTPGRNGNYEVDGATDTISASTDASGLDQQVINVINLLGGKENIDDVDACMTRLRVSVKDRSLVGSEESWKKCGAMGLIIKDNGVQAVYGPKADILKSDIQDALDANIEIPKSNFNDTSVEKQAESKQAMNKEVALLAVAAGEVIPIEEVKDEVFSQKMMGEGFGVNPTSGEVVSPVAAEIMTVFPSKHAIGLVTEDGLEILVHMGLDTVEMENSAFDVVVKEGDKVEAGQLLANADWDAVKKAGKGTTIVVIFTNSDKLQSLTLDQVGQQTKASVIGKVSL